MLITTDADSPLYLFFLTFFAIGSLKAESMRVTYGANSLLHETAALPERLDAISVAKDGTVFATGASMALTVFREGKIGQQVSFLNDEASGGPAIASTAEHVIVPIKKTDRAFFRRYDHQGQEIPWLEKIETLAEELNLPSVNGLWVHAERLYVSSTRAQQIVIIDLHTGKKISSFGAYRPHDLVVIDEVLYVNEAENLIIAYTLDGQLTGQKVGDDFTRAVALSTDTDGRLVVADGGEAQQLLFYNISHEPRLIRKLGEENGIYEDPRPGEIGPFRQIGLAGAGVDGAGRLYTLSNLGLSGFILRSYPDRYTPPAWESYRTEAHAAATAALGGAQPFLYTATNRYQIKNDGSMPQITWDAHLLNPFRCPDDLRHHFVTHDVLLTSDGTGLITMAHHWASLNLIIGSTTQPQLIISSQNLNQGKWKMPHQPTDGSWLWQDKNDDGKPTADEYHPWPVPAGARVFIDAQHGLWALDHSGTLWHSAKETPTTLYSHPLTTATPSDFFYDPTADQLTLWTADQVQIFSPVAPALKNKMAPSIQHEWKLNAASPSVKVSTARWDGQTLWVQDATHGSIYEFMPGSLTGREAMKSESSSPAGKTPLRTFQTFEKSPWGGFFLLPDPQTGLGLFFKKTP